MNKKSLLPLIFILLILISINLAEPHDNSNSGWGIGIISSIHGNRSQTTNFPDTLIPVFGFPKGNQIGFIGKDTSDPYSNPLLFLVISANQRKMTVSWVDLKEINYEGSCLKYYEQIDDYVNVLYHTLKRGVWIKISDLRDNGYYPQDWMNFLLDQRRAYFPNVEGGLNLRKNPNIKDKPIIVLHRVPGWILLTGKVEGLWAEVEFVQYASGDPFALNSKIANKWKGWIKAIDDKGFPNIWFYTRD